MTLLLNLQFQVYHSGSTMNKLQPRIKYINYIYHNYAMDHMACSGWMFSGWSETTKYIAWGRKGTKARRQKLQRILGHWAVQSLVHEISLAFMKISS